jgi:hypothetical protein
VVRRSSYSTTDGEGVVKEGFRDGLIAMLTRRADKEGAEPWTPSDIESTADAVVAFIAQQEEQS